MSFLPDLPLWGRVVVATVLTYVYVITLTRVSGKRTVASLTSFDWILNVAVGSLVAMSMTQPDTFWETNLAIGLVVGLQFVVSTMAFHSDRVGKLVTAEPTLLVHDGKLLKSAMARVRVNEDELATALRKAGVAKLKDAAAVVMETGGGLTVLSAKALRGSDPTDFALRELHGRDLKREVG